MNPDYKKIIEGAKKKKLIPTVSVTFEDGALLEIVFRPQEKRTAFVLWGDGRWSLETAFNLDQFHRLVPYSANNNLIKNEVVLLPSEPEEYDSEEELVNEIQAFIHRYVDVSALFEKIASYYVLFSWVYDCFNELPYLRLRGDPGSGKTRFLLTVGSLCYKPIFASGASTVSPLFRILDAFKGTLVIDESDFRFSDQTVEAVKMLNNGNLKGFPVLRSEPSSKGEFDPRAYQVFGPKIVATRGFFEDKALESRFLTEEMGQNRLRDDIPINLPSSYKGEALRIRNKLLLFRFRNFKKSRITESLVDRTIEPRLNQIFAPLLSIIEDEKARESLSELAREYNQEIISERGMGTEAQVLELIRDMLSSRFVDRLSIKEITSRFTDRHGGDYEKRITTKWIGNVIRKKLNLKTQKNHGTYVIPLTEVPKLNRLFEKYGINDRGSEEEAEETHPSDPKG